jgi:hypothetical protein
MKLKLIYCKVLERESRLCASRSPNEIEFIPVEQGLHNTPDKLRDELAKLLESVENTDAVLLGYGLCGNGTLGLSCRVPLVIPRAHDCVTFLLGSRQRHEEYSQKFPGSYIFTPGWIEESRMPCKDRDQRLLEEYTEKYGDDNARYLMEVEQAWRSQYHRAVYIDWDLPGKEQFIQYTKDCAEYLGWQFDIIEGDSSLLQRFLDGNWDPDEFLVLPPGQKIAEDMIGGCKLETQP